MANPFREKRAEVKYFLDAFGTVRALLLGNLRYRNGALTLRPGRHARSLFHAEIFPSFN
jgi:hypothetical protein